MPKFTKGGKKTKMADFESKVDASKLPGGVREKFAIANKVGLKQGSKTTPKGMAAAKPKMPPKRKHKMGGDEAMLRSKKMSD